MTAITPGTKVGALTIVGFTDQTNKRVVCRCVCKRVVQVSVEAIVSGSSTSCGCQPLTPFQNDRVRAETELRQRQRQQRRWRPGGGGS